MLLPQKLFWFLRFALVKKKKAQDYQNNTTRLRFIVMMALINIIVIVNAKVIDAVGLYCQPKRTNRQTQIQTVIQIHDLAFSLWGFLFSFSLYNERTMAIKQI